jgi:hypothetical protein
MAQACCSLEKQGGFANTGITSNKDQRTLDDPSPEDPIEFADTCG